MSLPIQELEMSMLCQRKFSLFCRALNVCMGRYSQIILLCIRGNKYQSYTLHLLTVRLTWCFKLSQYNFSVFSPPGVFFLSFCSLTQITKDTVLNLSEQLSAPIRTGGCSSSLSQVNELAITLTMPICIMLM